MTWSARGYETAADAIDALLAAKKELGGTAAWVGGNRLGEYRTSFPVLIEGELIGVNLDLTAYPNEPPLRFTITLNVPPCIWRLDFDPQHKRHRNPLDRAPLLGAYEINGPNYHAWSDNRHLASPKRLPPKLRCARALPEKIKRFDTALRWFCGETKIKIRREQMIDLPAKEGLL